MKKLFLRACVLFCPVSFVMVVHAQDWQAISPANVRVDESQKVIKPTVFSLQRINYHTLASILQMAPPEFTTDAGIRNMVFLLPMPDGSLQKFKVYNSPVMEPALAARFPEIRTYTIQGIDDAYASGRLDINPYFGFHAMVLSPNGGFFIDPYARGNTEYYMSYYKKDLRKEGIYTELPPIETAEYRSFQNTRTEAAAPCRGPQLFSYRLAVACTGEYAQAATGSSTPTVPQTLSAIVTSVNRVDGVYETEVGVRMVLVASETNVVYTDPATDPFNGNNNANTLINESQSVIDANIGNSNYDIGHTFSTGGGGLAYLGVVCNNANKARGITGSPSPVGDGYDIDYVAHEMGHEFGGNHTFNSTTSNCGGGNRNGTTAYEVGSGTTIMAYAGICTTDDIQPHSDPFFHTVSYDEIVNYILAGGNSCKVLITTGNNTPVITAMNNNGANIPENTPFTLTATATDADGDALTYCWEEWDLGSASAWNGGANSNTRPLFKSRVPITSGSRTIPDINVILAGYPASPAATMGGLKGETLPITGRAIKFRLTVRDNKAGGGGVATGGNGCDASFTSTFQINVINATGPFAVTIPNGGETYLGGSSQTITWNVAGTGSGSTINCTNVNILLSTDGGLSYPITVLSGTPNDGTQVLTIPNVPSTTTARFKIEATGNIFFDISDANFTINFNSALPVGYIDFTATALDNKINLAWRTAYELNNSGYDIERSEADANHFIKIGFAASRGNSNQANEYAFTDMNVKRNLRYFYRLKQTDMGGQYTYSVIRTAILKNSSLAAVMISPNPASDKITISLNNNKVKELEALVTDVSGKLVQHTSWKNLTGNTNTVINTSQLAKGTYFLKLWSGEDTEIIKFIKL